MKIAIVQDWLFTGGAEKVIESLHKLYPEAPIYTALSTQEWKRKLDGKVVTGIMDRWPLNKVCQFLPILQQHWFSSIDFSDFDIVISSSGNGAARFACSKIKTNRPRPVHIAYTLTPTHYYWGKYEQYLEDPGFHPKWLMRFGLRVLVGALRKRDFNAAQKADKLIAISTHIKKDIQSYYNRKSIVIWPPVDTDRFDNIQKIDRPNPFPFSYFIIWGRHVPYKRFDIAIEACNKLKEHLVVVGDGPDTARLKQLAGPTIHFVGRVSDDEINLLAKNALAFLSPQVEDFGIAPVEAMAAGLPVIAYRGGGALDYVIENETGLFFNEQTEKSMAEALKRFHKLSFNSKKIIKFSQNFSEKRFRSEIEYFVNKTIQQKS